jgi:hypothetical protein
MATSAMATTDARIVSMLLAMAGSTLTCAAMSTPETMPAQDVGSR